MSMPSTRLAPHTAVPTLSAVPPVLGATSPCLFCSRHSILLGPFTLSPGPHPSLLESVLYVRRSVFVLFIVL